MKKYVFITIVVIMAMFSAAAAPALAHDRFDVYIGPGPGPWPGYHHYYYDPYYYPYPPYPPPPPVIIQQAPPAIQVPAAPQAQPQTSQQDYWYYCPNPQGYYPYIKQCPSGWLKVLPPSGPPDDLSNSAPPAQPSQGNMPPYVPGDQGLKEMAPAPPYTGH